MTKGALQQKSTLFTSKFDLDLRKKLATCYILEHRFIWRSNLNFSKCVAEIPEMF